MKKKKNIRVYNNKKILNQYKRQQERRESIIQNKRDKSKAFIKKVNVNPNIFFKFH